MLVDTVSVQGVPVPGPNPQTLSNEGQGHPLLSLLPTGAHFALLWWNVRVHKGALSHYKHTTTNQGFVKQIK